MVGYTKNENGFPDEKEVIANKISQWLWWNFNGFSIGIDEAEKLAEHILAYKESKDLPIMEIKDCSKGEHTWVTNKEKTLVWCIACAKVKE